MCVISGFGRGVNEICALLGFYAASIGSLLPTFRDHSWCLCNYHSGVGTCRPVDWSVYLHLQGQQSKMKALRTTETSVTLHQSTGRTLRHLCENVMSHRIADRVTVYDASFTDV